MRTKKGSKIRQTFDPSENPLVFVQTDTCHTCVRFGIRVKSSVIPSVLDIGNSIGICADEQVSYMHALRDVRKSVGDFVGIVRR
jgi:hypothetical protein